MNKFCFLVPAALLMLIGCRMPETIYPSPSIQIHASAETVAKAIEKDGARLSVEHAVSPIVITVPEMKVERTADGVRVYQGSYGTQNKVWSEFVITSQGDGCNVVNYFLIENPKIKGHVGEGSKESCDARLAILTEIKRIAEAAPSK